MKKQLKAFALLFALIIFAATQAPAPSVAHAQTNAELQAQIAALIVRIQELTAQLNSLRAGGAAALPNAGSQIVGAQASTVKFAIGAQGAGTGGAWSSSQAQAVQEQAVAPAPIPASASYAGYSPEHPARIIVPAIGLDAPIEHMGINAKGEMAVPDGRGDNIGWYKDGTVPGRTGSAVLAAHVYAAFSELQHAPVGSDIYIVNRDNSRLHFVVSEKRTYDLNDLSPHLLFNRADDERLNLITCAGSYIPAMGTYDKRLVLYATLADQ